MLSCSTPRAQISLLFRTHRTPRSLLTELTILPARHSQQLLPVRLLRTIAACVARSNSPTTLPTTTPRSIFRRTLTSYPSTALAPEVVTATPWATLEPTRPCRLLARDPRPRSSGRLELDQPTTATA